ncbi:MAG: DUF928 domain-containing protein [Xanthomonadales bacterium]|nr:DUF928 domain-containing protein [Xanthomonadales bacterium]
MSRIFPLLLPGLLLLSASALAQGIRFEPHDATAPEATVAGSIRGAEGNLEVTVLAPPRLAATAMDAPVLYWHASGPISDPVELVLVEEGGVDPLVELRVETPLERGIHRFVLPPDTRLKPGTFYQWSVSVIPDPDARSNDVFSSALLQRVPSTGAPSSGAQAARELAGAGLWYDTLMALRQAKDDPETARLWRELMEQAGLQAVL